MARGKKNKRGKRQSRVKKNTPQSLASAWEVIEEIEAVDNLGGFVIGGKRLGSLAELMAAHAADPAKVDREIKQLMDQRVGEAEERAEQSQREAEENKRRQREADKRLGHVREIGKTFDLADLTEEHIAQIKEIDPEALAVVAALGRIQKVRHQRGQDETVSAQEIAAASGRKEADVARLLRLAEEGGLAVEDHAERRRLALGFKSTKREEPERKNILRLPEPENLTGDGGGLLLVTTTTLRHFAKIAREEGLPKAPTEEVIEELATYGRHIATDQEVLQTDEGHHYVRVSLLAVGKSYVREDAEDAGKYAGMPMSKVVDDLLRDDLPPAIVDLRERWVRLGWMEKGPEGWRWLKTMAEVHERMHRWEAERVGEPLDLQFDLPLRQFGLLLEAGKRRVPEDGGEDMPIHGGARSFEAIWRRHTKMADVVQMQGMELRSFITSEDADKTMMESPEKVLTPTTRWTANKVAASGVLANLRKCKTVAVDMDVSEGLPDWESIEEAWAYAQEAQLPFPITYFDFTTPGGYRPKLAMKDSAGVELALSLRAAMCWTLEDHITIAPFVWMEGDRDPENLEARTDYDSPGALHFGSEKKMRAKAQDGRDIVIDNELDPINHLRITSPDGISAPSQMLLTNALFGQPGWVDLFCDQQEMPEHGNDFEQLLQAEAMIVTAAACRVLSVIYALDSTVNIELVDADTTRPERRAVERAIQKGKPAEISKTVRIHPTKQNLEKVESDREVKREYSHAHWRRGHFAHYPIGTRMADRLAERDATKLVDHPVKGLCRKIYRKPTIVGAVGPDGEEREPVAKSYVWSRRPEKKTEAPTPEAVA